MHFKIKTIKGYKYLYLIKNERVDGKVKQTMQLCVGSPDKVFRLATSQLPTRVASYSFGKPAALMKAAEDVGLVESINRHVERKELPGFTPAQYLLLTIIGRSEHFLSRNVLDRYFKDSALKFVWRPKYKLSSQNFLNYMAKLDDDTIRKIEVDVSRTLIKLGFKPTRLIFDTTNFYTFIEKGEELPQKAHSKDKRYDKNHIGVGLAVTEENIPFYSGTFPANKSDTEQFSHFIDDLCNRLVAINIPLKDITVVFDRGMNSEDNFVKTVEKMHVIGSLPVSMARDLFKKPLSKYSDILKNGSNQEIKVYQDRGIWYDTDFTVVVTYNEATRRKKMHEYEKLMKTIPDKIKDIKASLNRKGRGRKLTAKGLINRVVDAIPRQHRGLFHYEALMVNGQLQLDFKIKDEAIVQYLEAMGKTAIVTNNHKLSIKDIVDGYGARNQIETDIKWLKDKLLIPLKPIYVRKDGQIRAHVFLCVMGLLLYNYLLHINGIQKLSIQRLSSCLDRIRLGLIYNGKIPSKKKNAEFVIENMDRESARIFTKLNLGIYIPG